MAVVNIKGRESAEVKALIAAGSMVYIGRAMGWSWGFKRSKWHNPKEHGTGLEAVNKYREYVLNKPELLAELHELRGKDLACWCKPEPCHGDILEELLSQEG